MYLLIFTSLGFNVVPLQDFDVHQALKERCNKIDTLVISSYVICNISTNQQEPYYPSYIL